MVASKVRFRLHSPAHGCLWCATERPQLAKIGIPFQAHPYRLNLACRIAQLDQRTALPHQHYVRRPRKKSGFGPKGDLFPRFTGLISKAGFVTSIFDDWPNSVKVILCRTNMSTVTKAPTYQTWSFAYARLKLFSSKRATSIQQRSISPDRDLREENWPS